MTPRRAGTVLGLLVLMTAFGVYAVLSTPEGGRAVGIWPVALATASLLVAPRAAARLLVPLILLLACGTIWVGGRSPDVAAGLGAGVALEVLVTWRILTRGRSARVPLRSIGDLSRFLTAVVAGAGVVAITAAMTSLLTGWGDPSLLALTIGSSGLAAQITLLPFFCELSTHEPLAGPVERAAQGILLLAVTLAVFVPSDFPSLVLLVLPVLAWGALRSGSFEALAQMVVVLAVAVPFTTEGRGPFSRPDTRFDVPVDMQGILLASFCTVCAVVVLILTMTVGEQLENARLVAAERDRMRSIVDGVTSVAIIGADLAGNVTLFNPGAERLLGYRADEVLGRSTQHLHPAAGIREKAAQLAVPDEFSTVAQTLMGRGPTEMQFVRKDGETRSHAMSLNRVLDDQGRVAGYVSTSEDVTERLEAEARLVEALDTERRAVEQLREVDRVKEAFVSSVSHELRTPLTSILGYTELLGDGMYGDLTCDQLDALRRVVSNSNRLMSLISELLALSRIQEDGIGPADQEVDLTEVMATGVAVLSPTLARRGVALETDLPDHPVTVIGDREMLERVVINLTDNAVKFTPDGGRVDVSLIEEPGWVVIEVADTGIGVPLHEQQRLFDRFFRSSLAQQQAIPGSGLGLSISRAIVEKHGGTLHMTSEPGLGSTFRVRLAAALV